MDELKKMLGVHFKRTTLDLLIDNRTDILVNKELLVRILSHLEGKEPAEIYKSIKKRRTETRQRIVDALPKYLIK